MLGGHGAGAPSRLKGSFDGGGKAASAQDDTVEGFRKVMNVSRSTGNPNLARDGRRSSGDIRNGPSAALFEHARTFSSGIELLSPLNAPTILNRRDKMEMPEG